jgi:hypothetical protein
MKGNIPVEQKWFILATIALVALLICIYIGAAVLTKFLDFSDSFSSGG